MQLHYVTLGFFIYYFYSWFFFFFLFLMALHTITLSVYGFFRRFRAFFSCCWLNPSAFVRVLFFFFFILCSDPKSNHHQKLYNASSAFQKSERQPWTMDFLKYSEIPEVYSIEKRRVRKFRVHILNIWKCPFRIIAGLLKRIYDGITNEI